MSALADVNGDGLDDIVGRNGAKWWVARSNGQAFVAENWGTWSTKVQWYDVRIADVDGDGCDDILGRAQNGEWWVVRLTA